MIVPITNAQLTTEVSAPRMNDAPRHHEGGVLGGRQLDLRRSGIGHSDVEPLIEKNVGGRRSRVRQHLSERKLTAGAAAAGDTDECGDEHDASHRPRVYLMQLSEHFCGLPQQNSREPQQALASRARSSAR